MDNCLGIDFSYKCGYMFYHSNYKCTRIYPNIMADDFPLDSQSDKYKRNVETKNQIAIGNR